MAQNCAVGSALCHSKAICVDYNPGYCCQCSTGFMGNGRNCLPIGNRFFSLFLSSICIKLIQLTTCNPLGLPQRINGKVSGEVNGVRIQDEDLHSYVVTSDGRAYTAVSKLNDTIGFDLQPLSMLGGVIGWLFAKSTSTNAPNGYQLTGGASIFISSLFGCEK